MATLRTGGDRVTVMPNPGLLDPRLLAPDFAGIGQGVGQGLGLVGQAVQLQNERAMAPKRQALADLQIAAAMEEAANAPTIRSLRDIQLQEAKRQAALAAIMPVDISDEGVFVEGGDFISPTGQYTDQVSGQVKQVFNPQTGNIETKRVPSAIIPGEQVRSALLAAQDKSALAQAKIDLDTAKAQAELSKVQLEMARAEAGKGNVVHKWEAIPSITGDRVKVVALGRNGEILSEKIVTAPAMETSGKKKTSGGGFFGMFGGGDKEADMSLSDLVTGSVGNGDTSSSGLSPEVSQFINSVDGDAADIPEAAAMPIRDKQLFDMQEMYKKNLAEFGAEHPTTVNQAIMIQNYLEGRPLSEGTIYGGGSLMDKLLGRDKPGPGQVTFEEYRAANPIQINQ